MFVFYLFFNRLNILKKKIFHLFKNYLSLKFTFNLPGWLGKKSLKQSSTITKQTIHISFKHRFFFYLGIKWFGIWNLKKS